MEKHSWVGKEINEVLVKDKRLIIKIGNKEIDVAKTFSIGDDYKFSLSKDNLEDLEKKRFNGKTIYAVRTYDGNVRIPKGKKIVTIKRITISIPVIKEVDGDVINTLIINYDFNKV